MKTSLCTFILVLFSYTTFSQSVLPVIHSNIREIDIREGQNFEKGNWFLAPEVNPDIYITNKIGEHLTFYTDIDSIKFLIHPDSVYNFIIVHGKDSAYTHVKYQPSYLDILKGAKEYNYNDLSAFPAFTYQDSSDLNLRELRKAFNLDSIAGTGDEFSRLLNVMHWIHELVPHDGNNGNPTVKNAFSMISACKAGDRGLNCRGLAIVLNECYLALGYKSRYVTCMPKDTIFNDCHVFNTVYSESLGKWIWLDPTHDSYVMDENGTPLSIEEVRLRLIEDKPVFLNPKANWNNKEATTTEYHLYEYMAKNLYRLECPLRSEYDYETNTKGKEKNFVELLPLDAHQQSPKKIEYSDKKRKIKNTVYKTNNPDLFWAKPY